MSLLFAAVIAGGIAFFAWKSRRQYLRLPTLPLAESDASVAVVIPARNEAHAIERVVGSLPPGTVTVVDDHSTDATVERATQAGARVIPAQPLPDGWKGKPNACWSGAQATQSDWILFVDADTWYEPGFVPSAIAYADAHNLAALSVFPRQVCLTWAERVLLPYAFGLYFCGVNSRNVNDENHPEALANGQCLLVRRSLYDTTGGHKTVSGSVIEDVSLAVLFKRHRARAHVLRAETLASVRMYDSFTALRRGFEKNSFRFLLANPRSGLQVIAASIVMTSWLPALAWLLAGSHLVAALLLTAVPVLAWSSWYGGVFPALRVLPAIYLFQLVALTGMIKTLFGLKTQWKGRPV